MADISFNIACKELKIAQIPQLNQLFQFLRLVHIYNSLVWVESYANEEKCKQWRQKRFAYWLRSLLSMQRFGLLCLQRLDMIQAEPAFLLLLQEDKRVSANRVVSPQPQNYICFQLRPCVKCRTSLTTVWVNQNYYIRLLRPGLHADSSHEKSLSRSKWNRLAKLSGFHTNRTRSSSANVKLWLCVSPGPKTRKGGGAPLPLLRSNRKRGRVRHLHAQTAFYFQNPWVRDELLLKR